MPEQLTRTKALSSVESAVAYNHRKAARTARGLTDLFANRKIGIPAASIPIAGFPASVAQAPATVHTRVRITGDTASPPNGVVAELGGSTAGLAIWLTSAGIFATAGAGVAASPNAVIVSQALAFTTTNFQTREFDIVFSVLPGNGTAWLALNGRQVSKASATGNSFGANGWASGDDGAFAAAPQGTIHQNVDAGSRVAPSNFEVIAPLSLFYGQVPRSFLL